MTKDTRPLILLINDDGIDSPGLAAAAAALDELGDLLIVAPSVQQSGMGRSFPVFNNGRMREQTVTHGEKSWPGYAANASPAQAVQHGLLELADRPVALAVSGVNYGENVGTGVTASGTVGAALEAASHGIPALAFSMEVPIEHHMTNDTGIDFAPSQHFVRYFAERWLNGARPPGVDVLKIDIPATATPETPWRITHLERGQYFIPVAPVRRSFDVDGRPDYMLNPRAAVDPDSDAGTVRAGIVSVTPLTLDLTAPIERDLMRAALDGDGQPESQ